ncbi:MAG TPA: ATP synthase subunit I [Bryobacteraceae bacterium]|nr:ATP synthase subunit I [Bryobacteraceae bacterium]
MDPDQLFYGRALARIQYLMWILSGAGLLVAAVYGGWRWAAGYLLGAIASYANFRWLKQMVSALSDAAAAKSPGTRFAVIFGLRYLLLGIGGYAILNFSTLSLTAAFVGLFVSVAAVILEILYELIYART